MVPILPRVTDQRAADARKLEKILLETGPLDGPVQTAKMATLAGDNRRLRGLPIVGRGIAGTAPGTDPPRALLARELRRGRG